MIEPGQKVRVCYTDACRQTITWDGTIVRQEGNQWRVDVGGIAILFDEKDITVQQEEQI